MKCQEYEKYTDGKQRKMDSSIISEEFSKILIYR